MWQAMTIARYNSIHSVLDLATCYVFLFTNMIGCLLVVIVSGCVVLVACFGCLKDSSLFVFLLFVLVVWRI